ncbi:MAG: hypothetical protein JWQ98_643 [Chlorobi bacterium]|nr:hypothetical protein [Chlorobiota bacterium]
MFTDPPRRNSQALNNFLIYKENATFYRRNSPSATITQTMRQFIAPWTSAPVMVICRRRDQGISSKALRSDRPCITYIVRIGWGIIRLWMIMSEQFARWKSAISECLNHVFIGTTHSIPGTLEGNIVSPADIIFATQFSPKPRKYRIHRASALPSISTMEALVSRSRIDRDINITAPDITSLQGQRSTLALSRHSRPPFDSPHSGRIST